MLKRGSLGHRFVGKEAGSREAAFSWKVMRKTEVDRRWLAKDRLVQPSGRCML